MKVKYLICVLVLSLTLGLTDLSAQTSRTARITFKRGATSSTVVGSLTGFRDRKVYAIKVRAGQTLSTHQTGSNNITLSITDPNGNDVTDSDASCNNRKSISPTVAGDYTITVTECQKADEWRGTFRFRITVD